MTEPDPTVEELKAQLAAAEAKAAEAPAGPSGEGTLIAEPEVSVAEQKAAGVAPDDTVTLAEQRAGAEAPDLDALGDGEAVPEPDLPPITTALRAGGGTSNEAPMLPPSAVTGAARAHALLEHAVSALADDDPAAVEAIIRRAQDELDRYLPAGVKAAAIPEAAQVMAAGL